MTHARTTAVAIGCALLATLIWGGWFPVSRLAVTTRLSPADVTLLRIAVPAVLLLPIVVRRGLKAGGAGWWGSLGMAATVGIPFPLLLNSGLQYAPAAHAAIFVPGVFPSITFVLGVVLLGDPLTRRRVAGVLLAAAGVGVVGWVAVETYRPGELDGYLFFHVCAWLWAGYTLITRVARIDPLHATAVLTVVSSLIYVPGYLAFAESGLPALPWSELIFQVSYHGLLGGLISMLLYNHAVNVLGASQSAIFGGLVPCIAAILSVPILGEVMGPREVVGLVLVSAGIVLVTGARLPGLGRGLNDDRGRSGGRGRPAARHPGS